MVNQIAGFLNWGLCASSRPPAPWHTVGDQKDVCATSGKKYPVEIGSSFLTIPLGIFSSSLKQRKWWVIPVLQGTYPFFFKMWPFFKSLYWICYNVAFLAFWPWGMWDPSSSIRDQTYTLYTGRQSLNHWTTREAPRPIFNVREICKHIKKFREPKKRKTWQSEGKVLPL